MDAHRDPAVDILAPQDVYPQLGRIQRRPVDIAINIDRHEPQLEPGGVDRGPLDRHRGVRPRELPWYFPWEMHLQEQPKMMLNKSSKLLTHLDMYLVFGLSIGTILLYGVPFFLNFTLSKYFFESNTTDKNLKTSLIQVKRQVESHVDIFALYVITYACWMLARMACLTFVDWRTQPGNSLKDSAQATIYRYLSLGSYAAVLFLALANGHVSYGLNNLATLVTQFSTEYLDWNRYFYHSNLLYWTVSSLVGLFEWLFGCMLYCLEHKLPPQVTTPRIAIISGIASVLVNVCVLLIYY